MMKTVKSIMFVLMFALIAGVAAPAYAETPQQFKGEDIVMRPVQKLGRGIANVVFSPLEIPMKWWDVQNEMGGIAGITYGTLKGVCFTLVRIGVGVLDIITFPFPLPNCPDNPDGYGPGYGPIMRPAWVIDVNHDWQNFVFSRQSVVTPLN
ncbi:MAG: exosortase system-associated protein, TIGR04073 family [Lentisphaeria bacterium]|nr:exosortase system-associated protein, TIGR04073 family [Lentisphaeria bacterium]MBQ7395059.1 exosortase system-associated protein, TIGR04073 family [Lentisphaeria bacterium]MBR7120367.1 exosortase system-associated protein, TIGR04073 family [Lentisphaeria bacterium]